VLARAEATLREHPELPQAAWLRAEVARAWSVRWLRAGDEERAKRAWQRAAALDGGRAAGLGEKDFDAPERVAARVRVEGPGDVRLDGVPVADGKVTCAPGEHALVVVRADGAVAWADWVSIAAGTELSVSPPTAPACSGADVASARLEGDGVDAGRVRCARWVAAVPGAKGAVRVATCERGACGPLVEWRVLSSGPWTLGPLPARPGDEHGKGPAWATWTLAGVGVAGTVAAVLAASGAFKSAPTETRFVNGGVQVRSF
jgi:hypothetical protein